jgi:hypothetical protein
LRVANPVTPTRSRGAERGLWGMGYIVALVLLLVIVPLLFVLLSRRSSSAGGMADRHRSRGVTFSQPSADQPTPGADATNQTTPGAEKRLPPG